MPPYDPEPALFLADWSAPLIQKHFKMPGISIPHLQSAGYMLLAAPFAWLFNKVPFLRNMRLDPDTIRKRLGLLGEPMILGFIIGFLLALLARQSAKDVLLTAVNTAAVMLVDVGVQQRIGAIPLAGGEIAWMDTGLPVTAGLSTNFGQSGWAFAAGSSVQPASPYVVRNLGDRPVKLATPALVPASWKPVQSKLIRWQSDGLTIEGLLYLPPEAKGKAPLVVNVHGGPAAFHARDRQAFANELDWWLARR